MCANILSSLEFNPYPFWSSVVSTPPFGAVPQCNKKSNILPDSLYSSFCDRANNYKEAPTSSPPPSNSKTSKFMSEVPLIKPQPPTLIPARLPNLPAFFSRWIKWCQSRIHWQRGNSPSKSRFGGSHRATCFTPLTTWFWLPHTTCGIPSRWSMVISAQHWNYQVPADNIQDHWIAWWVQTWRCYHNFNEHRGVSGTSSCQVGHQHHHTHG